MSRALPPGVRRKSGRTTLRTLQVAFCVCVLGSACAMSVREPKQNESFTLSPAHYGDTYFEGLRSPAEADGGETSGPPSGEERTRTLGDPSSAEPRPAAPAAPAPAASGKPAPASAAPGTPAPPRQREDKPPGSEPAPPAEPPPQGNEIYLD